MVNEQNPAMSTKAYILLRLRENSGEMVSGEKLARDLGISRVAVWKAVRVLQDSGYAVKGDDKGYTLAAGAGDDFLFPWEFGEREKLFRHWESTDSTMNRAQELADRGIRSGTVVTAETQTAGRGRAGRNWISGRGGLFFTLIERPCFPAVEYGRIALAANIAAARAVSGLTGAGAQLRWPNDVYIRGRKIAGILTEFRAEGDQLRWITLGIGININNSVLPDTSISCAGISGRRLSRRELLGSFLREFESLKESGYNPRELMKEWNIRAEGINRRVRITDPFHSSAPQRETAAGGVFLGIDSSGRGIVRTGTGLKRYVPGAASLQF
ncbi:biotin--[acetyl-CoA-carboxylase] ligase [Breznakiella homolactica]|uniref:Bifunctional ligase/repressor BirA n=1 Tax=Breznakiella homolactica TaxID=2798577 RepID=A0A7T7XKR6_9SPIR|nr:biotin--[acetyl-CoA-carboxylase] ligase [Breznakiella homolactica]QQO07993.1 biotin--[acetyl-CoA-carboxylase] ligase [Breznakiella homolactica]